jgi:hypothetical protein
MARLIDTGNEMACARDVNSSPFIDTFISVSLPARRRQQEDPAMVTTAEMEDQ